MADQTDFDVNVPNNGAEDHADMADTLAKVIANAFMKSENMLPCKVVSYDRVKNTAIVQPLIKIVMTGGTYSRGQIGPIPVFAFGAGNYVINYPVKAGDIGWMLANDRDVSLFEASLAESEPGSYRTHSFNDAVLFPDVIRNFDTTGEDGNMVIQSLDGKQRISIGPNQMRLTHDVGITLDAPGTNIKGTASVENSLSVGNGATGTITTGTGQIITVQNGIVINIA